MVSSIPSVLSRCFRVFIVNWTLLCGKGQENAVLHDFWKMSSIALEMSACSWHLEKKSQGYLPHIGTDKQWNAHLPEPVAVWLSLQGKPGPQSGARKPASADLFVIVCLFVIAVCLRVVLGCYRTESNGDVGCHGDVSASFPLSEPQRQMLWHDID